MKRIIYIILLSFCLFPAFGQYISFPTPELRVDTVKPLNGYGVTFMRPTTMVNKLLIRGNRVPPTFYFQIVDSLGYNRFGVTKNGMIIAGTHHDPSVNLDGLGIWGRQNALKGADAFAVGKGVINNADTTMALGYYYTVDESQKNASIFGYGVNRFEADAINSKLIGNRISVGNNANYGNNSVVIGNNFTNVEENTNMTAIGYSSNRIEMDASEGRFIGNWPGRTYVQTTEPNISTGTWAWWVNGSDYYIGLDYNNTQQWQKLGVTGGGGSGVTSVGLSMPGMFTVSGSPVTGSGTLTAALTSQTQATVFAAPATANGVPVFRALAETDIPNLNWTKITNRPTTLAGYGITDAYTKTNMQTSGQSQVHWDNITNKPAVGTGSVTSVGLSMPGIFTVSGSPVTSAGTLTAALTSQTQATVFAAPATANGVPLFRALAETDIPNLNWTKITNRPTTLSGYGITDAYTQTQTRSLVGDTATVLRNLIKNSGGITIRQNVGIETTTVMSQNAVTKMIFPDSNPTNRSIIRIGTTTDTNYGVSGYSIGIGTNVSAGYAAQAIGYYATASGDRSVALGNGTLANASWSTAIGMSAIAQGKASVAIGYGSATTVDDILTVSVGNMTDQVTYNKRIINMAAGINPTDAVNMAQFDLKGKIYIDNAEPNLPTDTFGFWINGSNWYLILNSGGTQKKLQLQ